MKIILILLTSVSLAHASLIDLTPGGFDETQPFPQVVQQFFGGYSHGQLNLAGANIVNGQPVWSPFTIFGDANFDLTLNAAGTGADVAWDLTGTGFHTLFVFVESSALIANLYRVPFGQQIVGGGFVEINGIIHPDASTFVGRADLPDTGHTIALLAAGLLAIAVYKWSAKKT